MNIFIPMGFISIILTFSALAQTPTKLNPSQLTLQIKGLLLANDLRGLDELLLTQAQSSLGLILRSYCELPKESTSISNWIFRKYEELPTNQQNSSRQDELLDCLHTSWKAKRWTNLNSILGRKDQLKLSDESIFFRMAKEISNQKDLEIFLRKENVETYIKHNTFPKSHSSIPACKKNEVTTSRRGSNILIDSKVTSVQPIAGSEEKGVRVTFKKVELLDGKLPDDSFEIVWPKFVFSNYLYFRETPKVGDRFILPLKKQGDAFQVIFQDCVLSSTDTNKKSIKVQLSKSEDLQKFNKNICSPNIQDQNSLNGWLKISSQTTLSLSPPSIASPLPSNLVYAGKIEVMAANGLKKVYQDSAPQTDNSTTYSVLNIYCDAGVANIQRSPYESNSEFTLVDLYDGSEIAEGLAAGFSADEKYFFISNQVGANYDELYHIENGSSSIYSCALRHTGTPCKVLWKNVGSLGYVASVKWRDHRLTVKFYDPHLIGIDDSTKQKNLQCSIKGRKIACKDDSGEEL